MNGISIKNLCIGYKDKTLIEHSDFEIKNGDVILLEGDNGTGKSTFLKALLGIDKNNMSVSGIIHFSTFEKNVLEMNDGNLLEMRSKIAYLEQKDEYDNNPFLTVKEVMVDSYMDYHNLKKMTKNDYAMIEKLFAKYTNNSIKFSLNSKVSKLSGGQQRLISILSSICVRSDASIFIIDEPLNNLDITTVVAISNILNMIVKENPSAIFIIITHCKIFPFINKTIKIENKKLIECEDSICNTCFGKCNEEGYYEEK